MINLNSVDTKRLSHIRAGEIIPALEVSQSSTQSWLKQCLYQKADKAFESLGFTEQQLVDLEWNIKEVLHLIHQHKQKPSLIYKYILSWDQINKHLVHVYRLLSLAWQPLMHNQLSSYQIVTENNSHNAFASRQLTGLVEDAHTKQVSLENGKESFRLFSSRQWKLLTFLSKFNDVASTFVEVSNSTRKRIDSDATEMLAKDFNWHVSSLNSVFSQRIPELKLRRAHDFALSFHLLAMAAHYQFQWVAAFYEKKNS